MKWPLTAVELQRGEDIKVRIRMALIEMYIEEGLTDEARVYIRRLGWSR